MYKIRVILDTKEDVIRTISINENCNLEQLHYAIANAFGFDGKEMASFYFSDENWIQSEEEIPLFDMSETSESNTMQKCILKNTLVLENDKLIYVYDFLKMWTFYVELVEVSTEIQEDAKVVLSVGEIPKEAPEKTFKADRVNNPEFDNDFQEFENIDDLDLDFF